MKSVWCVRHQAAGALNVVYSTEPTAAQIQELRDLLAPRYGTTSPKTGQPWNLYVVPSTMVEGTVETLRGQASITNPPTTGNGGIVITLGPVTIKLW